MNFAACNARFDAITKNVDWSRLLRIYGHGEFDLERNLRIRFLSRCGIRDSEIIEGIGWDQSRQFLNKIINRQSEWLEDVEKRLGLLPTRQTE